MRKRFTKIICAATAAISAFGLVFASACGNYKWQAVADKDTSAVVKDTNGGFLVQTGDYVYFINGKETYSADNTFGSVVKGSIQRIKKSDLEGGNYSSTETIVPSVIYSGQYSAGIYIYGDYIYYTTPSTQKDGSGNILNTTLDFKRSTLDGAETDRNYLWQCTDNTVEYRYVEVDDTVYILYAIAENLYGSSAKNIHSVNTKTGENKLLAYNVTNYAFDSKDATNPYVYYTMSVPYFTGGTDTFGYNQLYRVRADVSAAPREYDFSEVEDYNPSSDPVYVNYGDYVFDGIGTTESQTDGRVTQFNYAHWHTDKEYKLTNSGYNYTMNAYENGELYFTRKESAGSPAGIKYVLKDGDINEKWDAVEANKSLEKFLIMSDSTEYRFWYDAKSEKTYAISADSSGIKKGVLEDGVVKDSFILSEDSSANIMFFRDEESSVGTHTYLYYSLGGGNGYTFHRIAIDGEESDYTRLSTETEWNVTWTYRGVQILDLDTCVPGTEWYAPEFVGNTLVFASETYGMTSYNYIMACNLGKDGKMLSNKEIHELNEKYEKVTEKIEKYDEETNADGSMAYQNLSNALKYLWYTGDVDYLDKLINAYVDIEGKDKEYLYSERTAEIYIEFANADGDWKDYKEDSKKVNGETVYANSRDYYYSVLGKMTERDATGMKNYYKSQYMQSYPVDTSTWWEKMSTGGKVGFIIGMVALGLVVLGGIAVGTFFIVKAIKKKKSEGVSDSKIKVDITDDKNVDVYGETVE